ncbi:MAG TPA: S46 family peptidase [Stenotrophomonas sp.]|nr:S46 family peptidase [Stenotrophomonas sp.]
MRPIPIAFPLATLFVALHAQAGEGMWLPQQLPQIAAPLRQAGLKLAPEQLAELNGEPMGAVVALGGCTGSFVSPQGLVLTNHHCAYGAIQLNSTPQKNLIKDGFNAPTPAAELSAGPNERIYVLDGITDVTAPAKAAIAAAGNDALKRAQALEAFEKAQVAACEAEPGYRCHLFSFAGGNRYQLFKNLEIKDVRLAYAPPASVGNFGGDIDNFTWPRHNGDFSFYRAYVGKDGKPAAYSPDNVPYQPKHWLKFADQPLGAGDFVMVAGYPGGTDRYALASEFENHAHWTYPVGLAHYQHLIALVEAAGNQDPDIALKYASELEDWKNARKNYEGQLEGFARTDAVGRKRAEEAAVLAWLKRQGAPGKAGLQAHQRLVALNEQERSTQARDLVVSQLNYTGVLGVAVVLYRLALERAKPDAERERGYQERDLPGLEGALKQMEHRYVAAMDRRLQAYWLGQYIRLPAQQRLAAVDQWLGSAGAVAVEAVVARLAGTRLGDSDERLKWFKAGLATFHASDDPAIRYAVAVMPAVLAMERNAQMQKGEALRYRPVYLQALADYKKQQGELVYPDANASLRITFGNVKGYAPKDGVAYTPFTTLEGVVAKETGAHPFDSPKALLDAARAKRYAGLEDPRLGSLPVNFLSDLDIAGGSSGSPVLDAHGKLVGLFFDSNWESVSSDWVFDPAMSRTISVDRRYLEWFMREVAPAPQLLKELNLQR